MKQIVARPQVLAVQRARGLSATPQPSAATAMVPASASAVTVASNPNPNVLHPLGVNYRGQLLPTSRQASSNTSEGGGNRESSLDDSGVVDDHDEQEIMNIELANLPPTDVSTSRSRKHIYRCSAFGSPPPPSFLASPIQSPRIKWKFAFLI